MLAYNIILTNAYKKAIKYIYCYMTNKIMILHKYLKKGLIKPSNPFCNEI